MEKDGGRTGVARFLCWSLGEGAFGGSSSVRERETGAIEARLGRTALGTSGVDWA